MNREYHRWHSTRLHREMELVVFGHVGARVLVFPTRGGRSYEFEDMPMTEVLRRMDLVLTIGEADPFRGNNDHLSRILGEMGGPHAMHVWHESAHSARYWRRMAELHIQTIAWRGALVSDGALARAMGRGLVGRGFADVNQLHRQQAQRLEFGVGPPRAWSRNGIATSGGLGIGLVVGFAQGQQGDGKGRAQFVVAQVGRGADEGAHGLLAHEGHKAIFGGDPMGLGDGLGRRGAGVGGRSAHGHTLALRRQGALDE